MKSKEENLATYIDDDDVWRQAFGNPVFWLEKVGTKGTKSVQNPIK